MINPMKPKHHRAAERQRINFRVFRDFRGSSFSLTILLSFALLLAASPAPAQSPAILLDIKSPATASPPNASLLTLNEEGNLWIKGNRYDYTGKTITLDTNTDYWVIRDSAGKILLALEVYNRSTLQSTGNFYTANTFTPWSSNPDQTGALLRYTNTSGHVVFTLSAAGEARSANALPSAVPNEPDWDTILVPENIWKYVPGGSPQGCIFCAEPGNSDPDWSVYDVTGTDWRKRWDPTKATLADYGVTPGFFTYLFRPPAPGFGYTKPCLDGGVMKLWEEDIGVCVDDWGNLYPMFFGDTSWPWAPPLPVVGVTVHTSPISFHIVMVNAPWLYLGPDDGTNVDPSTWARSTVYLYDMTFTHPVPIPRRPEDAPVSAGCTLRPPGTPGLDRIELTLWDPAYPAHKCTFSASGNNSPSFTWDGKLYATANGLPDPQNPNAYFYTLASDVFMSATVFWNVPPTGAKAWQSSNDSFLESNVAFLSPTGLWCNSLPYHYDDQGVVSGAANPCPLILMASSQAEFEARLSWTIDAAAGSIPEAERHSDHPSHSLPSAPGTGNVTVRLEKLVQGGTWQDTGISASWPVTIYGSHLDRDRVNFKDGFRNDIFYMYTPRKRSDTISNTGEPGTRGPLSFNCHESSSHAYNGIKQGDWNLNPAVTENWTVCTKAELQKGDICYFRGQQAIEHSTTCLGNNIMWGANNGVTAIWNAVDIDTWLQQKRLKDPTVTGTYYKNPQNEQP